MKMLKFYEEHPDFDKFTKFDTQTGRLVTITEEEFRNVLPNNISEIRNDNTVQKIEGKNTTIFLGETPKTHVRFPRRIYFQITRNCSLHCDYCFIKAEKGEPDVPTSYIMDIAEFMGNNGLMEVRLTGGEPTIHPDFFAIMHKFKEEGVYVSVATNGLWNKRTLDALCEEQYLWVICSVDGNRKTHNRYRPNTFDRIIENLKQLRKRNPSTRIRLTTVLTKENKNQMVELVEICASIEAESITVIPLRPQVRDDRMKADMVKAIEFKEVIEDLIRAKDTFGIPFTTTMETDYKDDIYTDPIVRKRFSCAAGREATNLDYDAPKRRFIIYACSYSPASDLSAHPALRAPFLAGSFSHENIDLFYDIWRDEETWKIYRNLSIRSQSCKECAYLASYQCTGSCPIQNIDYSAINVDQDVLSQLREQIIHTGEWYCYKNIFSS